MTEDEAKTKWCPMARSGGDNRMPGRISPDAVAAWMEVRCIGSACMMWRYNIPQDNLRQWITDEGELAVARTKTPQGFCGVAGDNIMQPKLVAWSGD